MATTTMRTGAKALIVSALIAVSIQAEGALTFTVSDAGSWPNQSQHAAAVNAMQKVVNRYNAYGNFGNHDIYVYYNSGIPTARANYLGSIGFGGTYPNERVAQHETAHYLGSGTVSQWGNLMTGGSWDGPGATALEQQFEGLQEYMHGDSQHFWPYGLNYDSEGSEINKQRQVAMVYAQRADMGLGPTAYPSTATTVTMTASNPTGESGFNYKGQWSDGYFAHAGADYFTGNFAMRTPVSPYSFNFVGDSLTLNNTNGVNGGIYYKGQGTTGIIGFDDLILDGGWIQHQNGISDLFQLDGNLNVVSDSSISAKQGYINILADVTGDGDISIQPTDLPNENNRYVRFLSPNNSFVGNVVNQLRFELAVLGKYKFAIGPSGVNNAITGAAARNTLLNGSFELDMSGASSNLGDSWALVTAANTTYGASFSIAGFDNYGGVWSNGSYAFDQATRLLTVLSPPTVWNVDGSGSWSIAGNWTDGVPKTNEDAILGTVLTAPHAPAAINLDVPATLNRLTFDSANRYVVGGTNALTLTSAADIVANSGSHEIAVVVAGNSGLTKNGGGKVTFLAANTYSGDTHINAGTLALGGTASIASSSDIHVAASGTFDVTAATGGSYTLHNQTLTIDGDVIGNVVAANNSTVHVNSSNSMNGNLTTQSGSVVTGGASCR